MTSDAAIVNAAGCNCPKRRATACRSFSLSSPPSWRTTARRIASTNPRISSPLADGASHGIFPVFVLDPVEVGERIGLVLLRVRPFRQEHDVAFDSQGGRRHGIVAQNPA